MRFKFKTIFIDNEEKIGDLIDIYPVFNQLDVKIRFGSQVIECNLQTLLSARNLIKNTVKR